MRSPSMHCDDLSNVELPSLLCRPKGKNVKRAIVMNLHQTQYIVVEEVCEELNWHLSALNWDVKWVDSAVTVDTLARMQPHQKINHFPGISTLARKNNLEKNVAKLRQIFFQDYDFMPRTFLLPQDSGKLRAHMQHNANKTYIVKPEAGCQGRGIYLAQCTNEIQFQNNCVVQEYIDDPLLCEGLKFDFRVYALLAGCDPLRIYIYNQGLVRLATDPYAPPDSSNLDNLCMHLTNYAINKNSPSYLFNESLQDLSYGHKKSLAQFFQTLKNAGCPAQQYWADIKTIIVKTLIAGQAHLQHEYRAAQPHNFSNDMCFQILGFDFMIDANHKCYLLEVNHSPSLATDTPLDYLVKANLLKDALTLLNITPTARTNTQARTSQETNRRVFTGKTLKITPQERMALVAHFQMERDAHERTHLGSYERIYPSKNAGRQNKYQEFIQIAHLQYKDNLPNYRIKESFNHRNRAVSSSENQNKGRNFETQVKKNQGRLKSMYKSIIQCQSRYYDNPQQTRNSVRKQ